MHEKWLRIVDVDIEVREKVFLRQKIVLTEGVMGQLALIDIYRL
jgi:hypothetical protein